jgi:ribose transport system permease protein
MRTSTDASREARGQAAPSTQRSRSRWIERYGTLGFFVLVILVIGAVEQGAYLSADNILLVLGQNSYLAFAACAVTITLIAGQFDLSVGAVLGMSAILVTGLTANQGVPVPLAVGLVLVVGALAGLLNGTLVMLLHVNAFIATLGTSSAFAGLTLLYSDGHPIYDGIPDALTDAGRGTWLGLPLPLLYALALLAVLWLVTVHMVVGRHWYAVGSNREAARLAGVRVTASTIAAFVVTGVVAASGGVVLAARFGSADPRTGTDLVLPAFAAAFLGSSILSDGRFRVVGAVLATFFIALAANGLEILGIGSFIKPIFNGVVLVGALAIPRLLRRHPTPPVVPEA